MVGTPIGWCYGDANIQFWEWKHRFGIFAFANNYMVTNSVLMCFAYFMRLPFYIAIVLLKETSKGDENDLKK